MLDRVEGIARELSWVEANQVKLKVMEIDNKGRKYIGFADNSSGSSNL